MDLVILCIGNKYGGDDGIGPYIAKNLLNKKKDNFYVIDSGTNPENYTSIIKKLNPKILIIIDAVQMDLKPGDIRIIDKEKIGVMHLSTHNIPISLLINYLENYVKKIIFIGIQSGRMSGNLSKDCKKSSNILIEKILSNNYEIFEVIK
jgi:hydrogenase 3 maturation protease